jgi:hypothetical protein
MPSNRVYPKKPCFNLACQVLFHPHDSRQEFCSKQCRINYHNDKRKQQNEDRYFQEDQMRHNDKLLEALFEMDEYGQKDYITESALRYTGVNFEIGSWEQNLLTKRPIKWFHTYGLELIDKTNKLFTIHHRTKTQEL